MSEIDLNCCGATEPTNPKRDVFGRKSKRANHLFQLTNPIPDEIKDIDSIAKVFKKWNFVPYSSDGSMSQHSLLSWYLMLATLSPTNSAAIQKKLKFAVGGKARVIRSEDPEFDVGTESDPVSKDDAKMFVDNVKQFVKFDDGISKFVGKLGWQYEATGNGFVELSISTVMGNTRTSLKSYKTTSCLFVATNAGENKVVAISPVWTEKYLDKHPPRLVPMFPVFTKENGVLKTMFQLKSGSNEWYGRPPSDGSDVYKYREVQDSIYQVRAAATNFTGQLIIELEDDDPQFRPAIDDAEAINAGDENFVDRFEKNFTNKGDDPQSVVIASRPYGSRPMFVFQVSPNTKENWYKVTGEIAEMHILRSHMITPRFLGFEVSGGFSTDVYISDYVLNVQPVIAELHAEIMDFVNGILTECWRIVGKPELNEFSLAFAPPIQTTVDEFKVGSDSTPATAETPDPENTSADTTPEPDPNAQNIPFDEPASIRKQTRT